MPPKFDTGRNTQRQSSQSGTGRTMAWETIKKSVKSGALQFMGLEPSEEEKLFWGVVSRRAKEEPPSTQDPATSTATGISERKRDGAEVSQNRTELKPDLWKMAYRGVKEMVAARKLSTAEEGTDSAPPRGIPLHTIRKPDEATFGAEVGVSPERRVTADGEDQPDAPSERVHNVLFGRYDEGYGGLGLPTLLLRFKYKEHKQKELARLLPPRRPYFTYWLILVHVIIMIISLAEYGFAPYGWDLQTEQAIIQQNNLAFDTEERQVVPSVWGGPPQQALVLLGALYGPCMRKDRQLFDVIDADRAMENRSGCCVRRDNSGCVQVLDPASECPPLFADFRVLYNNDSIRAVCGMSPETCTDPVLNFFPGFDPLDILTWPICRSDVNEASTESHLTCEITGRPCCVGIQAFCFIATREHCDFLDGRFHQDAFLCSQVDCLNEICGLLPFLDFNEPDQVYRLWIALFLHAGLIHLFFSVLFNFCVLRHVEKRIGWFQTAFIYLFSGIGGNLVSAYFVPYNPKVGPAGSILGIVAYFFVFLFFEAQQLEKPWMEFIKLVFLVFFLFLIGLLPFIDNFAHIGGFGFGLLLSCIVVKPLKSLSKELEKGDKEASDGDEEDAIMGGSSNEEERNHFQIFKIVMVAVGIPVVVGLFILFFLLFYLVQDSWDGFTYVNCVPFTDTICLDLRGNIRSRDTLII